MDISKRVPRTKVPVPVGPGTAEMFWSLDSWCAAQLSVPNELITVKKHLSPFFFPFWLSFCRCSGTSVPQHTGAMGNSPEILDPCLMLDTLGGSYWTAQLQLVLCRGARTVAPSRSLLAALQELGREGQDVPSPDHPKGSAQRNAAPHLFGMG